MPSQETSCRSRDLRAFNPVPDVIHDGIADVMGNPSLAQSSPSSFFSWTCSSISSATTSFLRWSFCRSAAMVRWSSEWALWFLRSKAAEPSSKNCFCQA